MPEPTPSPEQDTRTAEEMIYLLEQEDPKVLAASAPAVTGLLRAIEQLDEVIRGGEGYLERARRMRERLAWIVAGVQKARPDKWAPAPVSTSPTPQARSKTP